MVFLGCQTLPSLYQSYRKIDISASLFVLDNKNNSGYRVITYFIAVHVKSRSLQRFSEIWAFTSLISRNCSIVWALSCWGHHSSGFCAMLVRNLDFPQKSQALGIYVTLAKLRRSDVNWNIPFLHIYRTPY